MYAPTPRQIKSYHVAILPQTTFPCCKSFGVLRTPSRRGRVRCTHQHQDKSNRITWRFFHRRHFLVANPLVCCAHRHDGVGCIACIRDKANQIALCGYPFTCDSSMPCHCSYNDAHGAPLPRRASLAKATQITHWLHLAMNGGAGYRQGVCFALVSIRRCRKSR